MGKMWKSLQSHKNKSKKINVRNYKIFSYIWKSHNYSVLQIRNSSSYSQIKIIKFKNDKRYCYSPTNKIISLHIRNSFK